MLFESFFEFLRKIIELLRPAYLFLRLYYYIIFEKILMGLIFIGSILRLEKLLNLKGKADYLKETLKNRTNNKNPFKHRKKKNLLKTFLTFIPSLLYDASIKVKANISLKPLQFKDSDHFPHKDFNTEWWYFTGILNAHSKAYPLGFEVTFFKSHSYFEGRILHIAFTDIDKDLFLTGSFNSLFYPQFLFKKEESEIISVLNNRLLFNEEGSSFKILGNTKDLKIDLNLKIQNEMPQGKDGIIAMKNKEEESSYYFSFPNLKTDGIISYKNEILPVKGFTWHDHQFGNFYTKGLAWDWFSLRFNDENLYIMLFNFRKKDLSTCSGNLYNGSKNHLLSYINIRAKEEYKTPDGIYYPIDWEIEVSGLDGKKYENPIMRFYIKPLMKKQYIKSFTVPSYWEGLCSAKAELLEDLEDLPLIKREFSGFAYAELTGYESF